MVFEELDMDDGSAVEVLRRARLRAGRPAPRRQRHRPPRRVRPRHIPGLLTIADLELQLSEILGRDVDLRTADDLSPYFRDVTAHARILYAAA
jgi:hypothetical protein